MYIHNVYRCFTKKKEQTLSMHIIYFEKLNLFLLSIIKKDFTS